MATKIIKNILILFCMVLMNHQTQADVLYSGATSSFGRLTYTVGNSGGVSVGGINLPKSAVDPNIHAVSELSMHPRFFTDWVVPGHFNQWTVSDSTGEPNNNQTATPTPTPLKTKPDITLTITNTPIVNIQQTPTPFQQQTEQISKIQIFDHPFSTQDISGGEDVDTTTDKQIVIRWNYTGTVPSEILLFVVYPSGERRFLTHMDALSVKEVVWDQSDQFSFAPEPEIAYRFLFYVIAKTGGYSIAGPYLSNSILLHVEEQQMPNTVIVTDDAESRINLVGRTDIDSERDMQLVIRWNLEVEDVQSVFVYVYINDITRGTLLSRVDDGSNFLVWNSANPLIQSAHQPGPQSGSRYRFDIIALTSSGNIISPITSGGYVTYLVDSSEIEKPTPKPTENNRPTATHTPTTTPTPIRVIPSPTIAVRSTSTPTIRVTPTATFTPTVTPVPVEVDIPLNTLIITDDEYSTEDLSGGEDVDKLYEEKLMIRWNLSEKSIRNIYVYVYINDSPSRTYLGSPPADQNYLVWEPFSSIIAPALREGPQDGNQYRFDILVRNTTSNRIIGPFSNAAPVNFKVVVQ